MWPNTAPFYHCHQCQRPLGRYLMSRAPRIYRIFSVIAAAKVIAALAGVIMLVGLIAGRHSLTSLAFAFAVQLTLYGATEITDGVLGLGSGIDRTARTVRDGRRARLWSWGKIAYGLVNCTLAALGFLIIAEHR